jgi:hypothetical protein
MLLRTRQLLLEQLGLDVLSVDSFVATMEICESHPNGFDLVVLGHSIPRKDKEAIVHRIQSACPAASILALLRPNESHVNGATRSVDAGEPREFIAAVAELKRSWGDRRRRSHLRDPNSR